VAALDAQVFHVWIDCREAPTRAWQIRRQQRSTSAASGTIRHEVGEDLVVGPVNSDVLI
jgi:hypothetical protein